MKSDFDAIFGVYYNYMQTIKLWQSVDGCSAIQTAPTSTCVVAVSGGVDSVVLLDVLSRQTKHQLVIAHVHHGIRPESDEEYKFVQSLAVMYGVPFEGVHLHLGSGASEALAREKRYEFLRSVAKRRNGRLVVAHHQDDVLETVALQLVRGTGWRGLAAMNAVDVWRPLLWHNKEELLLYAKEQQLEWREDASNYEMTYTRNQLRPKIAQLPQNVKQALFVLWHSQRLVQNKIDSEVSKFCTQQRHFYVMASPDAAQEVLRSTLISFGVACTRPQLRSLLVAIKVARPGSRYSVGRERFLLLGKTDFTLIKREK